MEQEEFLIASDGKHSTISLQTWEKGRLQSTLWTERIMSEDIAQTIADGQHAKSKTTIAEIAYFSNAMGNA